MSELREKVPGLFQYINRVSNNMSWLRALFCIEKQPKGRDNKYSALNMWQLY